MQSMLAWQEPPFAFTVIGRYVALQARMRGQKAAQTAGDQLWG